MFGNQSQFKQQKYQQFEVRKTGYGQTWNTELKTACCADPACEFCYGIEQLPSRSALALVLAVNNWTFACRLPPFRMLVCVIYLSARSYCCNVDIVGTSV